MLEPGLLDVLEASEGEESVAVMDMVDDSACLVWEGWSGMYVDYMYLGR
jgi:hypothetical protein